MPLHANEARARVHLTSLLPHILHQLTYYLDRPSAISLACTTSLIRPYAESSAWKDLNISAQRAFLPQRDAYDHLQPLGGHSLYSIREMYTWGPEKDQVDQDVDHPQALAKYMKELIGLLSGHDHWRRGVRAIYLDTDRLLSADFGSLLDLVKDTLKTLELFPPGFAYPTPEGRAPYTPRELFEGCSIRLNNLQNLVLPLDTNWDSCLSAVLKSTPNLRNLRLCSSQPYCGSWGKSIIYPNMGIDISQIPILPCLRDLEIDEMSMAFIDVVLKLVKGAKGLKRIGLRDPNGRIGTGACDSILAALSEVKGLEYLGSTGHDWEIGCSGGWF
jgi:hypothetical protein